MKIKGTGPSLTAFTDFYRKNCACAEKAKDLGAASGVSFSDAVQRAGRTSAAGKMDKIEITGHGEKSAFVPEKIKNNIRKEITGEASPSRLKSLKDQVSSGNYSVDPEELARILLTDR